MSNTWSGNPLVLDTAEDNAFCGIIQSFEYHPNAGENDIRVEDAAGNVLFKTRAPVGAPNNEAEGIIEKVITPPRPTVGVYLKVIDGGILYVHLHKTRN